LKFIGHPSWVSRLSAQSAQGDAREGIDTVTGQESTLIRGGIVVLGQTVSQQDVLIQGERIAAVGNLSGCKADVTLDAGGLLVLPGAVDVHVHYNDPFMNTVSVHDFYTGTLAAAYGGVTTVVDFSNQKHGQPLIDTLAYKREEAGDLPLVDWGVHPCIVDPTPETLDQIPLVVAAGAPSVKCYMTYREDGLYISSEDLKRIAARLHEAGGMLLAHAEDDEMITRNISDLVNAGLTGYAYHTRSKPPESEDKAISQCIEISRETGCRVFIVHLSSAAGAELVGAGRAQGVDILAETCTHYLVFTDEMLEREDGLKWICSPPLRDRENQDRLWAALRDGRISLVSSDDAAYPWEAKLYGLDRFDLVPNGLPGIEVRLSLLYSEGVARGRLSLPRFVEVVASTPAQLFGLAPRKGTLTPGADADVVLFDPQARWIMSRESLHMATDYAAYDGIEVMGKILQVFSRGELIVDGDQCLAEKGRGRYLHRTLDPSVRA
jgi:dihydropyrimidinase